MPPVKSVLIVDDDIWVREGRVRAFESQDDWRVAAALDHAGAIAHDQWTDVDLVLVDAYNPDGAFDHFAGVAVVEHIRRHRPGGVRVVVLSGHADNDLLRIRLAEAGANELFAHSSVTTFDELISLANELVSEPLRLTAELKRAGLSPRARVNDALAWAEHKLGDDALREGESQKTLAIGRRPLITARERIGSLAGLTGRTGSSTPEWRQVVEFLNRARGRERRSD
jgi:DNA-binding NarL/FixJ family response regulator